MFTSLKALAATTTVALATLATPAFAQQPVPDKAATMAAPADKPAAKAAAHKAKHHAHRAKHKAHKAAKAAAKKG
jgi:hypothetical protein